MKCIIVDDEKMARLAIRKHCEKVNYLKVVGEYENAMDALEKLDQQDVDLIFLDIHLPEITGIDLVKNYSQLPMIIFSTHHKDFALEAFEYNVVDYLLKPISFPRFLKAVQKAKQQHEATPSPGLANQEIFIKVDSRLVKLSINDILWVEAKGDYVLFKTDSKGHIVHSTLKNILKKLPTDKFAKVHRSYIVNLGKIIDIEDSTLVIKDKVIPISRANKENLMGKLNMI